METRLLNKSSLSALFEALRKNRLRVVGPRADGKRIVFEEMTAPEGTEGTPVAPCIQTTLSAKALVFPPVEELLRYTIRKEASVQDSAVDARPTVIFGLRPCDAASFAVLNSVFTWDYQDKFFKERLASTTVIAIACTQADENCFCTSVGGGPGDTRGSDILLSAMSDAEFLAQIVTERGQQIVALAPGLFSENTNGKKPKLADVPKEFEIAALESKLPALFNDEQLWIEQSLRCLGCGSCAFVCPTCVCFDIQDETRGESGRRLRCWDSCGLSLFTLHTSGHNPRSRQSMRWRQRIMHKFSYFKERLGFVGCVGCGRCSRACPADMNLLEHLKQLAEATQ